MAYRQSRMCARKRTRVFSRNSDEDDRDDGNSGGGNDQQSNIEDEGSSSSDVEVVANSEGNVKFTATAAAEELISYVGLAKQYATENDHQYLNQLVRVQTCVTEIKAAISKANGSILSGAYVEELEEWMNEYKQNLSPLQKHIIPGSGCASASLHIARAICRKTERKVVSLIRNESLDKEVQVYLNRLSDFLLVAARIAAKHDKHTEHIYVSSFDGTGGQE